MKTIKTILFFILLFSSIGLVSSCQEENVKPINGNITGQDDWEKHNV